MEPTLGCKAALDWIAKARKIKGLEKDSVFFAEVVPKQEWQNYLNNGASIRFLSRESALRLCRVLGTTVNMIVKMEDGLDTTKVRLPTRAATLADAIEKLVDAKISGKTAALQEARATLNAITRTYEL